MSYESYSIYTGTTIRNQKFPIDFKLKKNSNKVFINVKKK